MKSMGNPIKATGMSPMALASQDSIFSQNSKMRNTTMGNSNQEKPIYHMQSLSNKMKSNKLAPNFKISGPNPIKGSKRSLSN